MMSEEEIAFIKEFLEEARHCQSMSEFEEEFTDSLNERFEKYGQRTSLSDRQWEVINRIAEDTFGIEALDR